MNKFIAVGRIASDIEARTTQSGKTVTNFTIAINRAYKREGQPDADFFRVTAWGKQGEVINQYLGKGSQIALEGRMEIESYTDKNGIDRKNPVITLESFDFVGSKSDKKSQEQPEPVFDDDFSLMAEDDDLPF